jgi:phosphotransferase system HPr (HPr) family protein
MRFFYDNSENTEYHRWITTVVEHSMRKKTFIVKEEHGIHARPAYKIADTCRHLDSKVTLCKGCEEADGCSILQVMLLAANKGSEIEVIVEGGNEEASILQIADLFENGSGI